MHVVMIATNLNHGTKNTHTHVESLSIITIAKANYIYVIANLLLVRDITHAG